MKKNEKSIEPWEKNNNFKRSDEAYLENQNLFISKCDKLIRKMGGGKERY